VSGGKLGWHSLPIRSVSPQGDEGPEQKTKNQPQQFAGSILAVVLDVLQSKPSPELRQGHQHKLVLLHPSIETVALPAVLELQWLCCTAL